MIFLFVDNFTQTANTVEFHAISDAERYPSCGRVQYWLSVTETEIKNESRRENVYISFRYNYRRNNLL